MIPPVWPSRRDVVGGATCAVAAGVAGADTRSRRVVAGSYTDRGGPGVVTLARGGARWAIERTVTTLRNASYGVPSPDGDRLYLVSEQDHGRVAVLDRGGRSLADIDSGGASPCHLARSPDGRWLAAANYGDGAVSLWALDRRGLPLPPRIDVFPALTAALGPNAAAPHAHWTGFSADSRFLHTVDLGRDAVFTKRLGHEAAEPARLAFRATTGSGPRHLVLHPHMPIAYLVAEIANTVTILRCMPDGSFEERTRVSTLPEGHTGSSAAGHIALNRAGTRLYVSNRGDDSIATFVVAADGSLGRPRHRPSGGHWPRMFSLLEDERQILVANERTGTVSAIATNETGDLLDIVQTLGLPAVAFVRPWP